MVASHPNGRGCCGITATRLVLSVAICIILSSFALNIFFFHNHLTFKQDDHKKIIQVTQQLAEQQQQEQQQSPLPIPLPLTSQTDDPTTTTTTTTTEEPIRQHNKKSKWFINKLLTQNETAISTPTTAVPIPEPSPEPQSEPAPPEPAPAAAASVPVSVSVSASSPPPSSPPPIVTELVRPNYANANMNPNFMDKCIVPDISNTLQCPSSSTDVPQCHRLGEGRVFVIGDRVDYMSIVTQNWGNSLSPYWQARGVAYLTGKCFSTQNMWSNTWMDYLPSKVPQHSCPHIDEFKAFCSNPGSQCSTMEFAHKCVGSWNHIRTEMIYDTRTAIERHVTNRGDRVPSYNNTEMVIYDRCSPDTLLEHPEHSPTGHSVFNYIPSYITHIHHIYAHSRTTPLCDAIRISQKNYILTKYPHIIYNAPEQSIDQDWYALVYAPLVLVVSGGSSFAMMSAIANTGQVYMPPIYGGHTPYLGENWHWLDNPLLTRAAGTEAGFPIEKPRRTTEEINQVVQWLEQH